MVLARVFLALLLILSGRALAEQRSYTVDDMLRLEEIGKVRFDPSGDKLIFERYGPYDQQTDFGRPYVIGSARSTIYSIDLDRPSEAKPLFRQQAGHSYTLDSQSPDGESLIFNRLSETGFSKGVARLGRRQIRDLDISPDSVAFIETQWLSDRRIVLPVLKDGDTPTNVGLFAEERERVVTKWRDMRRGQTPTSSVLGSGKLVRTQERGESLVIVDTKNRDVQTLGTGVFPIQFASSDGDALAVLRQEELKIDPDKRINHAANMGGVQHSLHVYELAESGEPVNVCESCDILQESLNWSPSGRYLGFVARDEDDEWANATYRVYDRTTGRSDAVRIDGLVPSASSDGLSLGIRFAWLGEQLAVFARPAETSISDQSEKPRADWYLITDDGLRNLTGAFDKPAPDLVAVSQDSLLLAVDGEIWVVDSTGSRRNLTAGVDGPVTDWHPPSPFGRTPRYNMQPVDIILAQTGGGLSNSPKSLLFIDIASGRVDKVPSTSADAEIVAASAAARRVAFVDRSRGVTRLSVFDAEGDRRDIIEINTHLKDVLGGTPVRIDHKGPEGDDRMSWLLLPPGHENGNDLPTVVNVYPGSVGRETFTRFEMDEAHALNDHVLAAHGFAVLFPSLPVNYALVPRDPLDGLVEEVFAAVDAAVAAGHVDPHRLAVQGQSYGGYTTGALVGLTDRFKAAIAMAGPYNLTSMYGAFDLRLRLDAEFSGPRLFGVSLLETSQGGMGAPPWQDPERYLRNSPLMHVEKVTTPIMLMHGDYDYVGITQAEEFFTALTRLNKDALFVRYFGEGHVYSSPANILDMWARIFAWYEQYIGPPVEINAN